VGRSALDEDAIRLIEQHNPDVEFDWTRILKGQDAPPAPKPTSQQERRARPRPREFPVRVPGPAGPSSSFQKPEPLPVAPAVSTSELPIAESMSEAVPTEAPLELEIPVFEQNPNINIEVPADESLADTQSMTPAQARLGFEGLSRLRARHAEVLARISEKVTDTARRDELKSQADRLNPDTWVTEAEVTNGLEAYETVFESLRGVVGRRRKRRRNSGPGQALSTVPGARGPEPVGGSMDAGKEGDGPQKDRSPDPETADEVAPGADDSDEDL
jgi:hypothetical protein